MSLVDDEPEVHRRGVRPGAVALGVAVVAVLVWWAWPTWSGADDQLGVLVVGDGFVRDAERSIDLRVREEGMSVAWSEVDGGWCDAGDAIGEEVDRRDPEHVVVSFAAGADDTGCVDAVLDAIGDRDVVVVAQPGSTPALGATAADVVDPVRLVGVPGTTTMPCEWWEDPCPPGGVQVRDADGRLTDIGGERLARTIAAALRG